jgi:hypothetical protein
VRPARKGNPEQTAMVPSQEAHDWIVRSVLIVLELKFQSIPQDLVNAVSRTWDFEKLDRWFHAAMDAASLADFRHATNLRESFGGVLPLAFAEGEVKGQVRSLLRVLRARFGTLPADLEAAIQAQSDLAQLDLWLDAASTATTLTDFRQATGT